MALSVISNLLFKNWPRKIFAFLGAILVWWLVNSSIIDTKTIPSIPVRIVNLPQGKTVVGLLPNRLLTKRVTLTLSGTSDVIQELEPSDLEVLIDASAANSDDWVVHLTKKNLISLNPAIDIVRHVTQVDHREFVLKLSSVITDKIPIHVLPPLGELPNGYEYLDIWPQKLMQTVSGAQEEIQALKENGIDLQLHLSEVISKADLERQGLSNLSEEISYAVPDRWKKVMVNGTLDEINDPEAKELTIDILKKSVLPLGDSLPIRVFYPLITMREVNPENFPLATSILTQRVFGISFLRIPLYVKDVSKLFLEIIVNNLEIALVATPKNERELLHWSLEIIGSQELEDIYVAYLIGNMKDPHSAKRRESLIRNRFKTYLQRLILYSQPDQKFHLEAYLDETSIQVKVK